MIVTKEESIALIRYKYQIGVYGIPQMRQLVSNKIITKEQYFEITRKHYD